MPASVAFTSFLTSITEPSLIIPVGLIFAVSYYCLFTWAIHRFNLSTQGRISLTDTGAFPVQGTFPDPLDRCCCEFAFVAAVRRQILKTGFRNIGNPLIYCWNREGFSSPPRLFCVITLESDLFF